MTIGAATLSFSNIPTMVSPYNYQNTPTVTHFSTITATAATRTVTPTWTGTLTPIGTRNPTETESPTPIVVAPVEVGPYPESPTPKPSELTIFIFGTGLTSLISLTGFVSTTIIGWRKEVRDARVAELERRGLEIKLEKEKLELEKLPSVKPKQHTPSKLNTMEYSGIKPHKTHLSNASLKGLNGATAGQVYRLADGLLIGRSTKTSLQLSDPRVSRQHVRLRFGGGQWFIQDLNSKGGTFVNGKKVDAVALVNGDHIRIGSTEFEFHDYKNEP